METKRLFVLSASMDGEVKTFFYLLDEDKRPNAAELFLNSTAECSDNSIQAYCEEKFEEYQKSHNVLIDKVYFEYLDLDELDN